MNICITHTHMKKWQKEHRKKIRNSMLQTGSKRYPFPIDLKKASDWPYDRYHSSLCKHTGFIFYDIRTLIGCLFMLNIDDVSDYLSPWLLYLSSLCFCIDEESTKREPAYRKDCRWFERL